MQQEPLYPYAFEESQTSENPAQQNIYLSLLYQEKHLSGKHTVPTLKKCSLPKEKHIKDIN